MRGWLYVDNPVEALLLDATRGQLGTSYCVGVTGERKNRQGIEAIITLMDRLRPQGKPDARQITPDERPPRPRLPLCDQPHADPQRAALAAPPHV